MLVGFGLRNEFSDDESDLAALKKLGCERTYLVTDLDDLDSELGRVLEFLRPKDVLAVVSLMRLARDFAGLLPVLEKLSVLDIGLHAEAEGIRPGTPTSDSFLACAAALAGVARSFAAGTRNAREREIRTRGRPPALSQSEQIKAAKLLEERRASVLEVARMLHVSPATIYRYFPKNRRNHVRPRA
jgi:DNA invertase Pin-like site-specific DNA recombinase